MPVLQPGMTVFPRRAKLDSNLIRVNVYEGLGVRPTAVDAAIARRRAGDLACDSGGSSRKRLHRDNQCHRIRKGSIVRTCNAAHAKRLYDALHDSSLRMDPMTYDSTKQLWLDGYLLALCGLMHFDRSGKLIAELIRIEHARGCTRTATLLRDACALPYIIRLGTDMLVLNVTEQR